jgi:steroid Delta-isomerase
MLARTLPDVVKDLQYQFENCSRANIQQLIHFYAPNAVFKDPFQEVTGHAAIEHIFLKMFDQLHDPYFKVQETLIGDDKVAFLWDFHFAFKRWNKSPQSLRGVSWLYFDDSLMIQTHRDYWDPAEGIYEKLPILGSIMRALKSLA